MIRDVAIYALNRLVMDDRGWGRFEHITDLLADPAPVWPAAEGVYVLLAERTVFNYPAGGSSLFYVGRSSNLQQRLGDHRKHTLQKRDADDGTRFFPRYEWGAGHGALVSIATRPRSNSRNDAKDVEYELLRVFGDAFRAPPLGNSQSAW